MLLIVFLVLLLLNVVNYSVFNDTKNLRYRHWYRPVLFLIIALLALIFESEIKSLIPPYLSSLTFVSELLFCTFVVIVWIVLKKFLQIFKINDLLEALLKKYNTNTVLEKHRGFDNYLVWPYKIYGFKIYRQVGFGFFKILFLAALVLLIVVYLWTILKFNDTIFRLYTGIGALLITFVVEWILYFQCSVAEKQRVKYEEKAAKEENVYFLELFRRYVNKENGFNDSIIIGNIKRNVSKNYGKEISDNKELAKKYEEELINKEQDFIVASSNLLDHVTYFSKLLFNTLKNGGNILLLTDIPDHTKYRPNEVGIKSSSDKPEDISKLFALYLQEVIEKEIPTAKNLIDIGYFDADTYILLDKRIVLCSVDNANNDTLIHSPWIKDLDLVVVFQFYDNYSNNLTLKRQLSLWLNEQGIKYNTVFFKTYRAGGDESVTNTWTWKTTKNPPEVRLRNIASAHHVFFINFAYEQSENNLKKLLRGSAHEYDLSPGMELSVFAIMENLKHIHFFEGYNLDYIQSKNKLGGLQHSFIKDENYLDSKYNYGEKVTQEKIKSSIFVNNLPFVVSPSGNSFCEDKHLSVIFDVENNAPKLYKKYRHLGKEEAFICIVSKPHLFREFFASNMSYFIDVTLEALEPSLSQNKVNLCLQLLHLLTNEKIEVDYLKSLISLHGVEYDGNVVLLIQDLFKRYLELDITQSSMLKSDEKYVFENTTHRLSQTLTIDEPSIVDRSFFDAIREVKVVDSSNNTILKIKKHLLFQNFLPGQNIIINGTSYEFIRYDDNTKKLTLSPQRTENVIFYKPEAVIEVPKIKFVQFDKKETKKFMVNRERLNFSLKMFEAPIELYYTQYYSFEKFYHSLHAKANTPQIRELSKEFIEQSKRKYITRFLHLKWEVCSEFKEHLDLFTTQIHMLLYEFMPVLFPYHSQYIQIASNNVLKPNLRKLTPWIYPENNFDYNTEKPYIELYILEDSFSDLGILNALQDYFETIFKHLYDLLKWINDKTTGEYDGTYSEYIIGGAFPDDKLSFLSYGIPEEFAWDIELLLRFIKENAFFDTSAIDDNYDNLIKKYSAIDVECDYCAKTFKLSEVQIMEDGLHRCNDCAMDAVDTLSRAKELETEAKKLYKELLKIDFSQIDYEFKFVTATELHDYYNIPFEVTPKYDNRQMVGLATDRDIDVILVEKFRKPPETLSIIVHEMMHIFQFQRLNFFKLRNSEVELVEGMTRWAEWYLLENSGKPEYEEFANTIQNYSENDLSEYGVGYNYILRKYGDKYKDKYGDKYGDILIAKINKKYGINKLLY